MDLTYNSISGINTDPTVYLKEFVTKMEKKIPRSLLILEYTCLLHL